MGVGSERSLATRLGVAPMTLYDYIADRAALDLLVIDAVMAQVALPDERPDDWRDELELIATAVWKAIRSHPEAIPLIFTRRSRSPAVLDIAEALLGPLARSGRSGRRLLVAFRAVSAFIAGFIQGELAGPLTSAADESPEAIIERVRSLPADRYPHLISMAAAARRSRAETEFRDGFRQLLTGLAANTDVRRRGR